MFFSSALFLSLVGAYAHARALQSYAELDSANAFDFIVVGSGPGGATVASRLSENQDFNVLLIEAGPDNDGVEILRVPGQFLEVPATYQWNYTLVATPAVNNRSLAYTRGFVLGGSSSINGMVYSRGAADDYNGWATVTGDNNWSWDVLKPYFDKNERLVAPVGGRNVTGEYDPRLHSENGQVFVSLPSLGPTDFDLRCLNVTLNQPEFPFLLDMNDGQANGLAWQQQTIGDGERSSAATAYLGPDVRGRPNLTILLNTYVTRVLPTTSTSEQPEIRSVEIGDKITRQVLGNITASKEVVLSGGVIGTPQILLNSGIGNETELRAVGVAPIHSLPEVGKGLTDHTGANPLWNATTQDPTVDPDAALEEWRQNKTGPLSTAPVNRLVLWSRIPTNASLWSSYEDPASGPRTPHFELIVGFLGDNIAGGFLVWLNSPSIGSVALRSSDPFDDPVIDDGNLQSPIDIAALKEGFRLAKRFFSGPQWNSESATPNGPYLLSPLFLDPDTTPDAEFEAFLRETASTSLHGVGTASMSTRDGDEGVVDPELRVKGVVGLRIVDASAIPRVPAGHTQVPVYVLAERAADLIKASWA
ncbi:hypothetical protein NMY22_g3054 [Coprinellus aureogranulatus]|nr:hypothetical protein NMY22_g3054 [Coprinellus aureogranulatus]